MVTGEFAVSRINRTTVRAIASIDIERNAWRDPPTFDADLLVVIGDAAKRYRNPHDLLIV